MTRLTLLAAGLALALVAGTVLAQRTELPLDTGWRFSKGDPGAAMNPAFDDSAWRTVRVPHDWSQDEPFRPELGSGNGYAAGGIGWYRRSFTVDAAQRGRVARVVFDGVYDHAQVWINGHYVGGRPFGYSSFEFELTRHLKTDGSPNVLAVRVDHSREADSRYFTGSGIYREARLRFTDALHIAPWGAHVTTPRVTDQRAEVRAAADLVNAAGSVISPPKQTSKNSLTLQAVTPLRTTSSLRFK